MATEVGEYLVGAYLKLKIGCDVVDYNVRRPGGGLAGLEELDVIGFHFASSTVYLCEVMTHIRGLLYKSNKDTVKRVADKHIKQMNYARSQLAQFEHKVFMFWSPYVPVGFVTTNLQTISGLELVVNGEYKRRVDELQALARKNRQDTGNPVFRVFQILGALRRD